MSRPQDFFGADPKSVMNKPYLHVQDQKAYNVDGGTSIADVWTKRALNTVITNSIQGASLSSDEVTLPAGEYYIDASCPQRWNAGGTSAISAIFVNGSKVIQGPTEYAAGSSVETANVSGVVTLTTAGTLQLRYYSGTAQAIDGLGVSNSVGSITDASIPSIYADLKIWQLDKSLEIAPIAVNSGLQTINGMNTEGNVMGFDITKTAANQLTITKGSCLDSTLLEPLAFTANKTLSIPSVANTIYHIFAVKLVAGGYEARAYTSEAAVLSDNQVSHFRWIGFWKTTGSSVLFDGVMVDGILAWKGTVRPTIPSITAAWVGYDMTAIFPVSRLRSITFTTIPSMLYISLDGLDQFAETGYYNKINVEVPALPTIYLKRWDTSLDATINMVKLRR